MLKMFIHVMDYSKTPAGPLSGEGIDSGNSSTLAMYKK